METNDIWKTYMGNWVHMANIQGRIYEQLFSPSALALSAEQREQRGMGLAKEMRDLKDKYAQVCEAQRFQRHQLITRQLDVSTVKIESLRHYLKAFQYADEVAHLSCLATIHRSISPSAMPSQDCIDYAREALDVHLACASEYQDTDADMWEGYLHWSVIHVPFAPFTVILCHVIATSNGKDLQRLQDFTRTLQSASEASEAANNFYRLCHVFVQVATLYVEAKLRTETATSESIDNAASEDAEMMPWTEFDEYLNALGVGPPAFQDGTDIGLGPTLDPSASLENWFQGNQYMMGLLEQDLSYLDRPQ